MYVLFTNLIVSELAYIIMFHVPTLEPKKHKKSVLSLIKDYRFQDLQKRVSGWNSLFKVSINT